MAKATCSSCGERFYFDPHDLDHEPWMPPTCSDCSLAFGVDQIIDLFERGETSRAREALAEFTNDWPPPDSIVVTLINEADDAAARGDIEEALLRLRLTAHPKWSNPLDCKQQYDAAMIETRRAREACV